MGATYTRQSSYTDGDVITAAHTNDEFDQILAAFQASSGHTHDGTANEGGPITKLLGNSLTFGAATAGTDITITFDGETSDGVFAWMEDEDYFKFSDDILIVDDEQLIFGSDSNVAISYDEATTDSLKIAATEGAGLAITLMADEGDDAGDEWKLNIADGGTLTLGNDIASAGSYVTHLTLTPNSTVASSTLAVAGNLTVGGSLTLGSGAELAEAELEMLDGITAGTVAASKAMVVDANKDIGTVRNLTIDGTFSDGNYTFDTSGNVSGLGTIASGAITSTGIVTGTGFTAGSAVLAEAELELLDGLTAGTAIASKVVTTDASINTTGQNNLTISGELDAATGDFSSNVDIAGDLTLSAGADGALRFSAASSIKILDNSAASLVIEEADNAYMTFVTTNSSEAIKFDKALDINGAVQIDATFTSGVDGQGYDTKFFGDTSSAFMLWDTSADDLIFSGAAGLVVPDGQLVLGSTAVSSTATELNLLDGVSGLVQADFTKLAAVDSTAAELNIVDGDTSATATTLADADRVVVNDNGTMVQVALTDFETYFESALDTLSNVTTVGALNSGSITSGFGAIDNGSSAITTTGTITGGSLDISGNADIDGVTNLDNTDIDGTLVVDGSNISLDSTSTLNIDNSNTSNGITIGTATSGVPISIGHTTSEVTINDNMTVTGDLTVSGTTTTVNSTTVNLNDHNIVLDSGNSTSAVINGAGITLEGGTGTDASFLYSTTGPKFELKLGSDYEDLQVDQLIAASLDVSGNIDIDGTSNLDIVDIDGAVDMASTLTVAGVVDITDTTDSSDATGDTGALRVEGGASIAKKLFVGTDADIDGTLEADVITVNGTALNTVIAGVTVTNATNSAHVLVTDNESTNEENLITFVEGATDSTGNVGLEMDGNLSYNPSTGTVSATIFKGNIDAVDGDFDGTLEADAITVAGATLSSVIQDEATALAIALG